MASGIYVSKNWHSLTRALITSWTVLRRIHVLQLPSGGSHITHSYCQLTCSPPFREFFAGSRLCLKSQMKGSSSAGLSASAQRHHDIEVFGEDGQTLGHMIRHKAMRLASEKNLKLVLINPNSEPFPKYQLMTSRQYVEEQKRLRRTKAAEKTREARMVKIGASIASHDLSIKMSKVIEWLHKGHQVKVSISVSKDEKGADAVFSKVVELCKDSGVVQQAKKTQNDMTFQLIPKTLPSKTPVDNSTRNSTTTEADIVPPLIHHSDIIKDRKSCFQGHIASITDRRQVSVVLTCLKEDKKIAEASHFVLAYRIETANGDMDTGYEDGGEQPAGFRLLQQLTMLDVRNVVIIVTRWHGGVNLGSDRFRHITECARLVIHQHAHAVDTPVELLNKNVH